MSSVNGEHSVDVAEYVLGTATPEVVREVERRLADDADTRAELAYWEHRLGVLGLALEPVEPPAGVWQRIASAIAGRAADDGSTDPASSGVPETARAPAANAGLWRGLAIAATVVAVVLAGMLFHGIPQEPPTQNQAQPAYASVIYDKSTGASWLVTAKAHSRQMSVTAMRDYKVPPGKMLKGWLKPVNGKPIPLGKLPSTRGEYTLKVSKAAARLMSHASKIMVSMEKVSDADAAVPKGKLLWAAPVARHNG